MSTTYLKENSLYSHNTSDAKHVEFSFALNNPDTNCLELEQTPRLRAQSHKTASTSDASLKS